MVLHARLEDIGNDTARVVLSVCLVYRAAPHDTIQDSLVCALSEHHSSTFLCRQHNHVLQFLFPSFGSMTAGCQMTNPYCVLGIIDLQALQTNMNVLSGIVCSMASRLAQIF